MKAYGESSLHSMIDWREEQADRAARLAVESARALMQKGMSIEDAFAEAKRAALVQVEADVLRSFVAGGTGRVP